MWTRINTCSVYWNAKQDQHGLHVDNKIPPPPYNSTDIFGMSVIMTGIYITCYFQINIILKGCTLDVVDIYIIMNIHLLYILSTVMLVQ